MSQKYKLIQDIDDDRPSASIQRHLIVMAWLVIVPILAIIVLSTLSVLEGIRHRATIEREQREAIMTQVAMPTRTPRPTANPADTARRNAKANSALRRGPSFTYPTAETTRAGRPITLVGRDSSNQWFQLDEGTWINAYDVLGSLPILPVVPTP